MREEGTVGTELNRYTPVMRVTTLAPAALWAGLLACGGEHASSPSAAAVPSSVETAPASAAASAPAAAPTRAVLKVGGDQPGVLLSLDDRFVGPLPQEIEVTAGTHALHFAGARYESLDRSVEVPAGQTVDVGAVKLRVTRGRLTLAKATPGAKVFLERGSDRRELPKAPIAVDMDALPDWKVRATKAGYCDFEQPVDFSDGSPDKTIEVELHRPPCQ